MTIEPDVPPRHRPAPTQPPAFNIPGAVAVLIAILVLVHAGRAFMIGPVADERLVLDYAFIPACYTLACGEFLGRSAGALVWSPLTHAGLHGDWTHLGLNAVWLLAFGSPVARRIGTARFAAFSIVGALSGAAAFYVLNPQLLEPVIGASGLVSALMGGACRFALSGAARRTVGIGWTPRLTIGQALTDRTILFFIGVFFATNLLTGTAVGGYLSGGAQIAWEAHIGGFLFGFLAFALFDRKPARFAPPIPPAA